MSCCRKKSKKRHHSSKCKGCACNALQCSGIGRSVTVGFGGSTVSGTTIGSCGCRHKRNCCTTIASSTGGVTVFDCRNASFVQFNPS